MKDDKSKPVSEPAKVETKPAVEPAKVLVTEVVAPVEDVIPPVHEEPLKGAPETMKASELPPIVEDAIQKLMEHQQKLATEKPAPAPIVPTFVEPANPYEALLATFEATYPRGGTFHKKGEAGTTTMLTVAGRPFVQGSKILLPVNPPNTRKIRYVEIGDV